MWLNWVAVLTVALGLGSEVAAAGDVETTRAIGICSPKPNHDYSSENGISPVTSARGYFKLYEHRTVTGKPITTVLQQPAHGVLRLVTEADGKRFGEGRFVATNQLYVFLPDPDYVGKDSATILVDFAGVKVQVKYYFQATDVVSNDWMKDYCSKTGPFWKISSTLDLGNSTLLGWVRRAHAERV